MLEKLLSKIRQNCCDEYDEENLSHDDADHEKNEDETLSHEKKMTKLNRSKNYMFCMS